MNPKERAKPLAKSNHLDVLGNQSEMIPQVKSTKPSTSRGINGRFSIGDFMLLFVLDVKWIKQVLIYTKCKIDKF